MSFKANVAIRMARQMHDVPPINGVPSVYELSVKDTLNTAVYLGLVGARSFRLSGRHTEFEAGGSYAIHPI